MNIREVPKTQLISFFDRLENWAFLRNVDVFENLRRGGDCDLLVKDLEKASSVLLEELGVPILFARRSYLRSFYYPWGHIDLTDHYYWRGMKLLEGNEMIRNCSLKGGFPLVSPVDEAITQLFGSLLWGGFIKERYTSNVLRVFNENQKDFKGRCDQMLGFEASGTICRSLSRNEIDHLPSEIRLIRKSVRDFWRKSSWINYLFGSLRFGMAEVLLRLRDAMPVMIIKVNLKDREVFEEALEGEVENLDQHCRIIGLGEINTFGKRIRVILNAFSFRARNGILVIEESVTVFPRLLLRSLGVEFFVVDFSPEDGVGKSFDLFFLKCMRANGSIVHGEI